MIHCKTLDFKYRETDIFKMHNVNNISNEVLIVDRDNNQQIIYVNTNNPDVIKVNDKLFYNPNKKFPQKVHFITKDELDLLLQLEYNSQ